MTALMRVGDEASVQALLPYLRSQDAGQRAAAIEALQALPEAIAPFMAALLGDADSDVRILATELARNMPPKDATRVLCGLLEKEPHPNVCAAAVDVLAEVGTRDARAGAEGLRRAICRHAIPAVRHIDHHRADFRAPKAEAGWRLQKFRAHVPSTSRRTTSGGSANFSIAAPECCSTTTSATYIDRRLAERIAATGSGSFQSYFAMLRSDAEHEIEHLVNAFTVNETYFYREDHQLRCMTSNLLGDLLRRKGRGESIRIWSIPCSTGEEPYSIAIWLMENWGEVDKYNIEIVGSDIDTRALKAAAEGVYGARALMRLSRDMVERYFERIDDGQVRIDPGLRDSVQFTRANLIDAQDMARYRDFDIVFCRNVLIYFDDASRRIAAENLYDCLRPGGYICLGHSETMSRISPLFSVCRFPDAIVYQRPEADR